MNTNLSIKNITLAVNLGWTDQERSTAQAIQLDVDIRFLHSPKACDTDQLEDTLCYHTLIDLIRTNIQKREFRLIEHLAKTVFQLIETNLLPQTQLSVNITKHPLIEGLSGGVSFCYGNMT